MGAVMGTRRGGEIGKINKLVEEKEFDCDGVPYGYLKDVTIH